MTTPIYDQLATETPELACPLCHTLEVRGLIGGDEPFSDMAVCWHCWELGLHRPEFRAERTCVDCGVLCLGLSNGEDAYVVLMRDQRVLPLCRRHYEQRTQPAPPEGHTP